MKLLTTKIDELCAAIGRIIAWLALFIVVMQFAIVMLRYGFNFSSLQMQESVLYAFAFLFLLSIPNALQRNEHVRVDLIYSKCSPRAQTMIDLVGTIIFLVPMCGVLLWYGLPYAIRSWQILEGSVDVAGLPFLFLLKSALPLMALLTLLQAIANIVRYIDRLTHPTLAGSSK